VTLRAKVRKQHDLWVVELRFRDTFFGARFFLSWEQAMAWACWRLKPTVTESFDRRWQAGVG
jgi:hypothetical protein